MICGHIHHPEIRQIHDQKGNEVTYLNSGDWIENLSALEYHKGKWSIYYYDYDENLFTDDMEDTSTTLTDMNNKQIFNKILEEFQS